MAVVQSDVRLSECLIWDLQRKYYAKKGPEAWSTGTVPMWITNHPRLAGAFAQAAVSFVLDCLRGSGHPIRAGEPIHVVELGAGTGRFGFRFLRRIEALEHVLGPLGVRFRYVLTDISKSTVKGWRKHEQLAPFFASGQLDVACWSPLDDAPLTLEVSGERLVPGSLANPLIVIANYFVDTVATDLFRVGQGALDEGRVTLKSSAEGQGKPKPADFPHLSCEYEYVAVDAAYGDELLDDLLRWYADNLDETYHVPIPIGAIRALRRLEDLAAGRMLVRLADKGALDPSKFGGEEQGTPVVHGSLSFDANFDALRRLFEADGGVSYANHPRAHLSLVALVSKLRATDLPGLSAMWADLVLRDPCEHHGVLQEIQKGKDKIKPRLFTSLLRDSAFDPHIVSKFQSRVLPNVEKAGAGAREKMRLALETAWEQHFYIGEDEDIEFLFAALFFAIGDYDRSIQLYDVSRERHGEHHVTWHNIGVISLRRDRYDEAIALFDKSLALKPDYAAAKKNRALAVKLKGAP